MKLLKNITHFIFQHVHAGVTDVNS